MDGKAQHEGVSSGKRLTVTMEVDTLDCPICYEPLRPPIFQCSVGHFICSSCRGKHQDNKCHICSTKTTFNRCFGMEHVVQSVKVPCSNAMYGCTKKLTYYQKEKHEKVTCYALRCFCPVSSCRFTGPTEPFLDHLTTQHKFPSTALPDSDTVSLRLQQGFTCSATHRDQLFVPAKLVSIACCTCHLNCLRPT